MDQFLLWYMKLALCGFDVMLAQLLLDVFDVHPLLQQMGHIAMPT